MFTGLEAVRVNPMRRWITVGSFSLQATLVAAALIFPLLRPATLPDMRRVIFRPLSAGVVHSQPEHDATNSAPSTAPTLAPLVVRARPAIRTTNVGPASSNVTGPPNIAVIGDPNSGIQSILPDQNSRPMPQPAHVATHNPPVSVIMEGNLLRKVKPHYPAIAVQMGLQGTVVIKAMISREGMVEHPQVISGQAFLAVAAMDAVKEWRYRPYYLNGQPVEVETEIIVNFVLNR